MNISSPNLGIDLTSRGKWVPASCIYSNEQLISLHPQMSRLSLVQQRERARRIQKRFGYKERAMVRLPGATFQGGELTSGDLALLAVESAVSFAPMSEAQLLIFGTTTPSRYGGTDSIRLSAIIGNNLPAIETRAGCATSLMVLHLAFSQMCAFYSRVCVVVSETLSKVANPKIAEHWFGLADGAASLYLEVNNSNPQFRVLKTVYYTNSRYDGLYTTRGKLPPIESSFCLEDFYLSGDALAFRSAVIAGYDELIEHLLPTPEERAEINWVLSQQVDLDTIQSIKERHRIAGSIVSNVGDVGNLGGAAVLHLIVTSLEKRVFSKGDKILLISVGGGLTLAGQVWKCMRDVY